MPDMTPAPRRRPLWRLFIMPALLRRSPRRRGAGSGSMRPPRSACAAAWRAQEAKSGRVYDCGKRAVARLPVPLRSRAADDASVALVSQTAGAAECSCSPHGSAKSWSSPRSTSRNCGSPNSTAPATLADRGQPPSLKVSWSIGQQQRVRAAGYSAARLHRVQQSSIDRVNGPVATPLARANQVELHGRIAEGSTQDQSGDRNRVADSRRQRAGRAPAAGQPFDAGVRRQADRPEGFFAKALAGTVSGNPGGRRPCRDRAVAAFSRAT